MQEPDELSLFAERLEQINAPYMVTGATAAIIYGQPRVTNDLDVVLSLDDASRQKLLQAFPEHDFYVPPETVIRAEQARSLRGHFNLIHHKSGYLSGGKGSAPCVGPSFTPKNFLATRA